MVDMGKFECVRSKTGFSILAMRGLDRLEIMRLNDEGIAAGITVLLSRHPDVNYNDVIKLYAPFIVEFVQRNHITEFLEAKIQWQ